MEVLELLAEQVEQSGVRTIEGSVVGDDSYFLDEPYGVSWGWDDLQWPYGAPVSALSFNENSVELSITSDPASPKATAAEWSPNADYYTLDNAMTFAARSETARPGLDRKTRSMINLTMLAALNRGAEFRLHLRAALTNGVTRDEIKEILLQIGAYCGIPACLEAFRIATEVFKDVDSAQGNKGGSD